LEERLTQKQSDDLTTRARILEATVRLLYSGQLPELTTRRIAAEAQVNVAAINYYFRSKDELMDEAVQAATAAAFDRGMQMLRAPGKPPLDRLREYLFGYSTGLVKFPWVTRAAWTGLYLKEGGDTFYGRFMRAMLDLVRQVIEEIRGLRDEDSAAPGRPGGSGASGTGSTTAALMVLSCVIFPFLVSNTLRDAGAIDYTDDEARRRYIDTTLARLVGDRREEN
jgi:AcrR family transcriptional regulator